MMGLLLSLCGGAKGSNLVSAEPLTSGILLLHFKDGSVQHHGKGQKRSDEKVISDPLDVSRASLAASFTVTSLDDTEYKAPKHPSSVGRKSKGTDFAWFVDKWENNMAVNDRPDHTSEHWLYLRLPTPLKAGKTYTVNTGGLAKNGTKWKLTFLETSSRSEAVHVNTLGYVPSAPGKYAYIYHWMGDRGGLPVAPMVGRRFWLWDVAGKREVFQGKLAARLSHKAAETAHIEDAPPFGNFLGVDVAEADFSRFAKPGQYVVAVEGVGCSFPFKIEEDIYREAFRTVARGLYHNRSGIALKAPFTTFERPAPHNPSVTPGFKGKLMYTTVRWQEWGSEGGDNAKLEAGFKGPLDAWGWYQDAGDWDGYETHLRVAQELLFAYQMAPKNFSDGELNIPESGNGVPDILDEASWLPRFCYRLRHELVKKGWGTGGVGLRISGDAFGGDGEGVPSYEDVQRTWAVSGEDPVSTFRYAGVAAHLAHVLQIAQTKDPQGVDWAAEARECYAWAVKNMKPGDEKGTAVHQAYAAAALFRLTGERPYEVTFGKLAALGDGAMLWGEEGYGPFVYVLGGKGIPDPDLLERARSTVFRTADESGVNTVSKRALRWGGNYWFPMVVGQQTTPLVLELAVAATIAPPDRAKVYRGALYTTCDYFLGTNSLNMTWVTGLGPRHPLQVFHMDAWYNGKGRFHPGLIPYGPWRKDREFGQGPWDSAWANKTIYPSGIDNWPGNERWFDNRCSPLSGEFTVHQNSAPAAAIFGFLCAAGK
jgi:hypothetical protein